MRTCDLCEALEGTDLACPCHCHALVGELRTENDALKARNADMSRALGEAAVTEHALRAKVAELEGERGEGYNEPHERWVALRQQLALAREALKRVQGMCDIGERTTCPCGRPTGVAAVHACASRALAAISEPTTDPTPGERCTCLCHGDMARMLAGCRSCHVCEGKHAAATTESGGEGERGG